jgi:hypothetical protein
LAHHTPPYEIQKKALLIHFITIWQIRIKEDPDCEINQARKEFFSNIKDLTYHKFWVKVSLSENLDYTVYCAEVPAVHLKVPPADWHNCGLYDNIVTMVQDQPWLYDATYQDIETLPDLYWWSAMELDEEDRMQQIQKWAWDKDFNHIQHLTQGLQRMFFRERQGADDT